MNEKAKNISELMDKLDIQKTTKKAVEKEINKRTLANLLFTIRCDQNLTQKQMAEKLGCTQSKISKLEKTYDEKITIKDLLDYAKVLNLQVQIGFNRKRVKIADLIKFHVRKIEYYMEKLSDLAEKDQDLDKGIGELLEQATTVYLNAFVKNISKLDYFKKYIPVKKQPIHVSPPIKILREESEDFLAKK